MIELHHKKRLNFCGLVIRCGGGIEKPPYFKWRLKNLFFIAIVVIKNSK